MKRIIVMLLAVVSLFVFASCDSSKKLEWPDDKLGELIPRIENASGEVVSKNLDYLRINLDDISESQYLDYIVDCKSNGFNIEAVESGSVYYSFTAFNSNGYKIDINYYFDGDMDISVYAPISMSDFDWPDSDIAKMLPIPDSNYGKIEWEAEYGFVIYVGNTTKTEYKDYVSAVYALGFTVDYKKGDYYFYADNADGYSVSLKYEGFNTMFVRIDEPKEEEGGTNGENDNSNNNTNNNGASNNNDANSGELTDEIRPEFKEAIDSYEAFFDEYCAFMKKYNSSSNPTSMIGDYMSFMSRYTETMSKLNEISNDSNKINTAELIYYTEAMTRINQKLLEIN